MAPLNRAWCEESALVDECVNFARVRLHVGGLPAWYLRRVKKSAITFGNHIWFVDNAKRDNVPLLVHELVHVAQYSERGFVRFLVRYTWDMAKAGFKYSRHLPLEAPAYARQTAARALVRPSHTGRADA